MRGVAMAQSKIVLPFDVPYPAFCLAVGAALAAAGNSGHGTFVWAGFAFYLGGGVVKSPVLTELLALFVRKEEPGSTKPEFKIRAEDGRHSGDDLEPESQKTSAA